MAKTDKVVYNDRVFQVQDWVIKGWPSSLIIEQILKAEWVTSRRQAERYIAEAVDRWTEVKTGDLEKKRDLKVQELKHLRSTLNEKFKGTPEGMRIQLDIEKEIIKLEGMAVGNTKKIDLGNKDDKPFQVEDRTDVPAALIEKLINAL